MNSASNKVVFIPGFGSPTNWIPFSKGDIPDEVDILLMKISPVASLHDRVCQIYYQLRGGKVDYGEEHSNFHQHGRYGKTYQKGLYEEWSEKNPIIVIGHSIGIFTI